MTPGTPAPTAKNAPSRPGARSGASKVRVPHSVLPKALRRGGKRPLKLRWPEHPRRQHLGLSKRQWAHVQRGEHAYLGRVVARAMAARKAAAK